MKWNTTQEVSHIRWNINNILTETRPLEHDDQSIKSYTSMDLKNIREAMEKDTKYKGLPYTVCKKVRKLRLNKRGHRTQNLILNALFLSTV